MGKIFLIYGKICSGKSYFAKRLKEEFNAVILSTDEVWQNNIDERNARIQSGNGGSDFFVDEGLLNKVKSMFEVPEKEEIDVWHKIER